MGIDTMTTAERLISEIIRGLENYAEPRGLAPMVKQFQPKFPVARALEIRMYDAGTVIKNSDGRVIGGELVETVTLEARACPSLVQLAKKHMNAEERMTFRNTSVEGQKQREMSYYCDRTLIVSTRSADSKISGTSTVFLMKDDADVSPLEVNTQFGTAVSVMTGILDEALTYHNQAALMKNEPTRDSGPGR